MALNLITAPGERSPNGSLLITGKLLKACTATNVHTYTAGERRNSFNIGATALVPKQNCVDQINEKRHEAYAGGPPCPLNRDLSDRSS